MKSRLTIIALLVFSLMPLRQGFGQPAQADEPAPVKSLVPQTNAAVSATTEDEIDPRAGQYSKDVSIKGDQVFATINGKTIKGSDLALFGKGFENKPQTLSGQAYQQLLSQAIDRELIQQAAKQENISLTDVQKKQLDDIKAAVVERAKAPWSGAGRDTGTVDERAAFEQHDAESQMLLVNLMTKRGVPPPHMDITDEQVKAHYDSHKDEFEPMPKDAKAKEEAWKAVDFKIRRFYALTAVDVYSAECRKAIAEWKSKADVVMSGQK